MQILEFLKNYWAMIIFFGGEIVAIISIGVYTFQGIKCSLRNDILTIYEKAKERGNKITRWEFEAIEHSAELYFKLKGNSFVKDILEKVKNFEVID